MMKRIKTDLPGVRYYEHPSRRHNRRPDRNYLIRYTVDGQEIEQAIGWASEGMNPDKAFEERQKFKKAAKKGIGPKTQKEERQAESKRKEAERLEKEKREKEQLTFGEYFQKTYFPQAEANKAEQTCLREASLFVHWIEDVIGKLPFKEIKEIHLEQIKMNMKKKELSARSIRYALAVIRQTFNSAKRNRIVEGENPVSKVSFPQEDNRRLRFLTHKEVNTLLSELKKRNRCLYEMSIVSLQCGLRSGEIASLCWKDILLEQRQIIVRDSKNKVNRIAYMTDMVFDIFDQKTRGQNEKLVFTDRKGNKLKDHNISRDFSNIVSKLGFNDDVKDRRDKVVFHTLRHCFCSFLVENGEDLYVVKELAGHKCISQTQRYSHLRNERLQNAVSRLGECFKSNGKHGNAEE